MKHWKCILGLALTILYIPLTWAHSSIEGRWVTVDEKTGERRAVLQLGVENGTLHGEIASVFPKPGDTGICSKCPGDFKDKKILGLQIVWGLKEKKPGAWADGYILDAQAGKIYRVKMTVKKNKLYVRGFVGVAFLGRTQIWERDNPTALKDTRASYVR